MIVNGLVAGGGRMTGKVRRWDGLESRQVGPAGLEGKEGLVIDSWDFHQSG